ncbi:TPA: N-acetylmuramoyl-L-alanine amidase family protein [Campylobacter coli]|uniref:N-acetylmuramoyl-L-alanine amidase family protein n=1 Tax=Campylobacter coli TaxID=195 RepID=UPI0013EF0173|nr:N-acetylmuramoyl-L-alanine amidase [Campylobacter coli]EFS3718090.1 N-acetylmuramoyl-L-alanine amidase [Campylobacter coli]EHN9876392.1 N-acetylmuramoyl-L-alanine amidase [Campylobacter coli]EHQ5397333.1 N-acetylmuramoyl-L-alanine amidase [Campylobacter coli]MCC2554441.1 N-acetylmuramoyl-L-alanine amidase [Campylobacter coli]MCC2556613.1 N-acetylmuramoyl-L-alanine amidase [Campylobacter coli]
MFRILVFCIALFSICFGAYENELANFDKNFIASKNDAQVKFHHQLKSLYIQSVINEDEKTKIEILKRLIISSNALNLDDKSYANELEESGVSKASINALRKAVIKDKQKVQPDSKNVEVSSFEPPKSTSKPPQTKQESTKTQNNKPQQTKKVDKVYVLKSSKTSQGVVFDLNTNLEQKDIKSFALDEKGNYRYISDFEGILEGGRKEYKFDDYRIVISQYNPKMIRIVAYAKEKIPLNFDFEDEKISISKKSQAIQKSTPSKQESKTAAKQESEKVVAKQESKPVKTQEAKTNTKKEQENDEPLYVLDVDKSSNSVVLNLSDELDEKDITSFSTKDQKFFRQVVSFQGILEGSRKNFTFGQNAVTVTQYNPKTVRIVLSSTKEFKLFKDLDDKSLTLGFSGSTSKSTSTSSKNTSKTASKNVLNSNFKSDKLIVLDAGHGGKDSGALSDKKGSLKEKDIVLSTTLKLGNELKKRGYKVLYTRSSDKFINLRDRTKYANDKRADLFLSIHANAAPNASKAKSSEGVETFFLSPARSERSKKAAEKENQGDFEEINYFSKQSILNFLNREKIVASNKLAIDVQKNILTQTRKKYKIVDGGVREAPFWVLVGAQMPAILIEIGYITHPSEGKRIANKSFQDTLVKGIADGVENYFYNNR